MPQTHATDEKTVLKGVKFFEHEQNIEKFLAEHRAKHTVGVVSLVGDGDVRFISKATQI